MQMAQAVFLATLFPGVFLLVASIMVARTNWRADVSPFGLDTRSFDVLQHPEKYARPEAVRLIRALAGLGVTSLAVAISALVFGLSARKP